MMTNRLVNVFARLLVLVTIATAFLFTSAGAAKAYADDSWGPLGSITVDGQTTEYYIHEQLKEDLEKLKYKTVTVEMLRDWNVRDTRSGVRIDEHLVIPAGSIVTLNMNGYMIDRGLTVTDGSGQTGQSGGDVITVRKGAVLRVEGGWDDCNAAYAYTSADLPMPMGTMSSSLAATTTGFTCPRKSRP